jgi:ornithine decarboxylase
LHAFSFLPLEVHAERLAKAMTTTCGVTDEFEGSEKTVTICFKGSKIAARSLRLIPHECWEEVLRHARCEILSHAESNSADVPSQSKKKKVNTKGLTGYILSESSLFLSDTTVTLKTCGRTTPLEALEPVLDLVVPGWHQKYPGQYLKFVSFTRLGYMFPKEQPEPHGSWTEEVKHLNKHFQGEAVSLGSEGCAARHVYVANYLPKGEISDVFSTQVTLTKLDSGESMVRFAPHPAYAGPEGAHPAPLQAAWKQLHGDEPRSPAVRAAVFDEHFFEPFGYSANCVFGRHFTTVHATPQPSSSYISIETSLPLNKEAKQRFALGAEAMCRADSLTLTEFSLTPSLFLGGQPTEIPGFMVQRRSQSVGANFACAIHEYTRGTPIFQDIRASPCLSAMTSPGLSAISSDGMDTEALDHLALDIPLFEVPDPHQAIVQAAELAMNTPDQEGRLLENDVPMVLLDVGVLERKAEVWRRLLPRVEPFYAVKCNPHTALVEKLSSLWQKWGSGGFDCASPSEMSLVLGLGVDPARQIVYANPCKQGTAVDFARKAGLKMIVFDNMAELDKLKRVCPEADLILRVQTDDRLAQCPLSNKFGARMEDCQALFERARDLGLKVAGVSFHVGSGCSQVGSFRNALLRARAVFDEAERQGYAPALLDIGGGFPGWDEEGQVTFADHAADISTLLDELFPSPTVRVIAEPGRYFVAASQTLLTTVISVAMTDQGCRYYLNDGLYGSFNCLLYDHATVPKPTVFRNRKVLREADAGAPSPCTIFGPTCDGFDMITDSMHMPPLQVGDKLLFPNMGAYTSAATTQFNGFEPAASFVYKSCLAGDCCDN